MVYVVLFEPSEAPGEQFGPLSHVKTAFRKKMQVEMGVLNNFVDSLAEDTAHLNKFARNVEALTVSTHGPLCSRKQESGTRQRQD